MIRIWDPGSTTRESTLECLRCLQCYNLMTTIQPRRLLTWHRGASHTRWIVGGSTYTHRNSYVVQIISPRQIYSKKFARLWQSRAKIINFLTSLPSVQKISLVLRKKIRIIFILIWKLFFNTESTNSVENCTETEDFVLKIGIIFHRLHNHFILFIEGLGTSRTDTTLIWLTSSGTGKRRDDLNTNF